MSRNTPIVSVVMPAYNAAAYIEDSVNSVLNQTVSDFELIVVEDRSKDNTWELLKELADKDTRIVLYRNEKNSGVSFTRTFGLKTARGVWIAFLDSDDMWREDKLEKQLEALSKDGKSVISYTASSFITQDNKPFSYIMRADPKMTYNKLLRKNLISCSSTMVKREVMQQYSFDGDKMHEDYSCWLRILKKTPYAVGVDEPLLIYRIVQNSKSHGRLNSAKMIFNSYRYVGFNYVSAFLLTIRYSFHSISKHRKINRSNQA
jgi:teichuronic acid biosynthesis glycosyltransferase TuaG